MKRGILFFLISIALVNANGQDGNIRNRSMTWVSINSMGKIKGHWSLLADLHIRRQDFISDPGFYFLRVGGAYHLNKKQFIAVGAAHMWLASTVQNAHFFVEENRIYQQWQMSTPVKKANLLNRVRVEERWQQSIVNGGKTGYDRFSVRFRYLLSYTQPVFKNPHFPALVLSDEILIQTGPAIEKNHIDQNRIFLGIRQKLSKKLAFDFGYMNQLQQKPDGRNWDQNHTLRWFFYLNY